jgi:hypothetical protein
LSQSSQRELQLDFGEQQRTASPPQARRGQALPATPTASLAEQAAAFQEFGQSTRILSTTSNSFSGETLEVPTYVNEYWTARQRQASSLHEVSYRACFKPQLPRFFIERLTCPGDKVYDPFMGRGTAPLEAALLGRVPLGCDINPLSLTFVRPRLQPPLLDDIQQRLREIPFDDHTECPEEFLAFYHPETLKQICALRTYLLRRQQTKAYDALDDWIALVAVNRLTGHSNGFFSVYTLPPNQATSVKSQLKINERRQQTPSLRNVPELIFRKSRQLLGECTEQLRDTLRSVQPQALLLTAQADSTPQIAANSVALVVTSPPFLDVVQYATDNWLRCWFLGIDPKSVQLTVPKKLPAWQQIMTDVFHELHRVLRPGGHIAFEVGEVHGGATRLEEAVLPCGLAAGLEPILILINDQEFTKTANCWGISNMSKGTNTNRIVVFRKRASC